MINKLLTLLGFGPAIDFKALHQAGAILVDVRTPSEYAAYHLQGAINHPVQSLANSYSKIPKGKTVIVYCASGMRSAAAKSLLASKGINVYNGGSLAKLQSKIA